MISEFKVTVIIPFYNAREFVSQAVESAFAQPETGEVILIEDKSPDGGLEVCQELEKKYDKLRLLRHEDCENHGAAATRNLGILNASLPYIAFLDADDYFLPMRFARVAKIFSEHQDAEGVYEAIGAVFQDEEALKIWKRLPISELTTITKIVSPEDLFEKMISGGIGTFSFDGFTGKRELFSRVGLFNDKLKIMEDTELMFKLAAKGQLYPGCIEQPVAMRRVHNKNRITYLLDNKRETYNFNNELWQALIEWGKINLSVEKQELILFRCVERFRKADYFDDHKLSDYLASRKRMFKLAFENPKLLVDYRFWRMVIPSKSLFNSKLGNKG